MSNRDRNQPEPGFAGFVASLATLLVAASAIGYVYAGSTGAITAMAVATIVWTLIGVRSI